MLGCMPVIRKGITKCLLITLLPTKYCNSLEKTDPSWTEIQHQIAYVQQVDGKRQYTKVYVKHNHNKATNQ